MLQWLYCTLTFVFYDLNAVKFIWEIHTNNHKSFCFFHLNPPNKFLSTLAIKKLLRPKYPSLISTPTISLTHLSQSELP